MRDEQTRAALSHLCDALAALRDIVNLSQPPEFVAREHMPDWEAAFARFEGALNEAAYQVQRDEVPA